MSIAIKLDNPGILSPGASITGTVICQFHSEQVIRGVECSFRGKEYVRWTQGGKNKVTYIGENKFISEDILCVGKGTMDVGVYQYPFFFKLPDRPLPSSFTEELGSIQYYVKAKVDRPFAFDYEDKIALHVASPVDLNDMVDQLLLRPVTYKLEEFPTFCCCTSEPINMDLTVNKDAFLIGDVIDTKLQVSNTSGVRIEQIKMSLVSHLKFIAEKPRQAERFKETEVVEKYDTGMGAHSECTYHFQLRVPEILIPNFPDCYLIKQWWTLRVRIILPPLRKNINSEIKVILGHVAVGTIGVVPDVPSIGTSPFYPTGETTGGRPRPSAPLAGQYKGAPLLDDDGPSAPPPSYVAATS